MVQTDVDPLGVIDSARTYCTCASLASWTSGWYSCWARAVPMALMPPKKGLRVSLLDPPVSPTFRSPPFFAAAAATVVGVVAVVVVGLPDPEALGADPEPQASSNPPAANAAPPTSAERRNVRRSRLQPTCFATPSPS
jgi:hypothetical protein